MAIVCNENVKSCMNCKFRDYEQNDNGYACYNTCIRPEGECDFTKRRTGVLDKNGVEIYEGDYIRWFDEYFIYYIRNNTFDYRYRYIDRENTEIIDPDKIETYTNENGVEKWRVKE